MRKFDGDPAYRPISAWGYVGYTILFAIPIIGWIFLIVFTFSGKNINRRSFARSVWIWALIMAVLLIAVFQPLRERVAGLAGNLPGLSGKGAPSHEQASSLPEAEKPSGAARDAVSATEAPKGVEEPPVEAETTEAPEAKGGVTPEFKALMDSYEKFFDEYVDFMKGYDENDLTNLGALAKYTQFLTQYADTMSKLEEIDEDELSAADDAYYIEVMARIDKKLLGAAN